MAAGAASHLKSKHAAEGSRETPAPPDDLYRCKGIVPFAAEEAADETARLGLPPPEASAATKLGDSWWLFNGVAGRLTLEPLRNCAGPASIVFMGRDLRLRAPAIEEALRLPPGSVGDARAPKPAFGPGDGLVACGVALGLSRPIGGGGGEGVREVVE